jgi:hypothetical protein
MGCRTPQLPVGMAAEQNPSGWTFSLLHGYRQSDDTYSGTEDTGGGLSTTMSQSIANLAWQANAKLGISLSVPYFWEFHREEIGEQTVDLEGLGDMRLALNYRPFAEKKSFWTGLELVAGMELPTGADDNRVINDDLGFALFEGLSTNSQFQLGSGTWDPFFGANFTRSVGGGFSVYNQSLVQLSFGESSKGYEPGNLFSTELGAQYKVTESVSLQLGLEGVWRGRDQLSGETILNTGGTVLSATAAATWKITNKFSLIAGAKLPVYRDLNASRFAPALAEELGTSISSQSSPGPYLFGGVTLRF